MSVGIQREEGINGDYEDAAERVQDDAVDDDEGIVERSMPAEMWMCSSENALDKEEVDNEQQDDSRIQEDLSGNDDVDIVVAGSPNNSKDTSDDSCHTEAYQTT